MADSPASSLLLTKLLPLRPAADVIDRPRLQSRQALARQLRLSLIVAPGGFGKSTLAAGWLAAWQAEGLPVAWLSLGPADDDPMRFVMYLANALNRLHPEVGVTVLSLLANRLLAEPRTLVSLLINDLAGHLDEAALVIDDYQWINDPAVHELMNQFLAHAPGGLHLLLTARTQPPLALSRLRAQGECLDVGAAELRFDPEETASFMATAPAEPPTAELVQRLHASTEGWPAALRIAKRARRLPLHGEEAPFSGASRAFGYLLDDALAQLPASTLDFMACTAILEHLDPEVCNAVTGSQDAHEQLAGLLKSALLVEPLDTQGHRLRYHQLLKDYLLGPVALRRGLDLQALHRHAAAWYAGQEHWYEAVRHALAAGDAETSVAWLDRCGVDMLKRGDLLTLLSWSRQLPPALMRDRVELKLALAWGMTLAMRPGEAAALVAEIEQIAALAPEPLQALALRAHVAVLRAGAATVRDMPVQALDHLAALDVGLLDDWTAEAVANIQRFAHWKCGRWAEAREAGSGRPLQQGIAHNAFMLIYRECLQSRMAFEAGSLAGAERHALAAQQLYELHGSEHSAYRAIGAPLVADVWYEKSQCAAVEALLGPTQVMIDTTALLDSVLLAALARSRSAWVLGHRPRAQQLLDSALRLAHQRQWPRLEAAVLLQRLQWLAQEGRTEAACACLQDLETLAQGHAATPRGTGSELVFFHAFGQAQMACFEARYGPACESLAALRQAAGTEGDTLRAITLGLWLAQAQRAHGLAAEAHATLEAALRQARAGGLRRTVLDAAPFPQGSAGAAPMPELLRRFMLHPRCDRPLAAYLQDLLVSASSPAPTAEDAAGLAALSRGRQLSLREREVLMLVELGLPNKEIARRLAITSETVKTHLARIFHKLEVDNRAQAVNAARVLGLLDAG